MSVRPRERQILEYVSNQEDKIRTNLSNIIDNINCNNLTRFYPKDESLFKKRIDKLNLKFYIETEKYLTQKNNMENVERCQDQLFIILFKQISLYIEEIERLNNHIIRDKVVDEKSTKEKIDELNRKEKEQISNQLTINNLKINIKNLEKKLEDKTKSEERFRIENESLKRQVKFYKDKLEIDLVSKKSQNLLHQKKKILDEMNNSILSGTEIPIRSSSKESMIKKPLVILKGATSPMNPTSSIISVKNCPYNSSNSEKEIINFTADLNSTKPISSNSNNKLLCVQSNNVAENVTMNKILNKKRNYSDSNPNQTKKNINIVSVSINNRSNEPQNQISTSNFPGKVNTINDTEKIRRENTKSLIITKNINIKSQYVVDVSNNSSVINHFEMKQKISSDGKGMSKTQSKNQKNYNIIKSIKQLKPESQEYDSSEAKIVSPKANPKFINLHFDPCLINVSNSTSGSNSNLNEYFMQDQILTTFNILDDELNYLGELEKMINNTNLNQLDNSGSYQWNDGENISNHKKFHINNPSSDSEKLNIFKEIGKRSESVENAAGHVFVFSDEEGDGYKSGASCFSDEQYKIPRNNQQTVGNKFAESSSKQLNMKKNVSKTKGTGYPVFSSVTIDLMSKQKSKNSIKITLPKKGEAAGILNKVKNK